MKDTHEEIIKGYIKTLIDNESKYILLTNGHDYFTVFKTNNNLEKTMSNILNILNNLEDGELYALENKDNQINMALTKTNRTYNILDFTLGVVE